MLFERTFFGHEVKINPGDHIAIHEGERGLVAYLCVDLSRHDCRSFPIFPNRAQKLELHPGIAKITGLKSKKTYGFFTAEMTPALTAPTDQQVAQYLYDHSLFHATVRTLSFGDSSVIALERECFHCLDSEMNDVSDIAAKWLCDFDHQVIKSETRNAIDLLLSCGYLKDSYSQPSDADLLRVIQTKRNLKAKTIHWVQLPDEKGTAVVLTDRYWWPLDVAVVTKESGVDMGLLLAFIERYHYNVVTSLSLLDFCSLNLHGCTADQLFKSVEPFKSITNDLIGEDSYENELIKEAADCNLLRKYRICDTTVVFYDAIFADKKFDNTRLSMVLDFSTEEIQQIIQEVNRVNATARKRIANMVKKGKIPCPTGGTRW